MNNIYLLDCTLRDGGYVNNWEFGEENIKEVARKVVQAGVEIIECGYLSTKNAGNKNVARYTNIQDVSRAYAPAKSTRQDYAVMVNYGEYPENLFGMASEDSPIIRVAFHKKDLDGAFEYFGSLKEKGYRFYVQPMGALNYSDEEYVQLIRKTNELEPEAFYIVDSFGVIELKDFRRLLFLTDNNLKNDIKLGYHSHNNLQQAYSNSKYMVEQNLDHDLIIDASVFGMGRGAGNLNIELFAKYLNQNFGKTYNIEPILEVFDECLKPIFAKNFWGYSLPFYLSAIHNCHPNYAAYFAEKNTLTVRSMHEILTMISETDRNSFSIEKASTYYTKYQERYVDDHEAVNKLKEKITGRSILILAPGSSLVKEQDRIKAYIRSNNPVIFGVNKISTEYDYDYLYLANEKRVSSLPAEKVKEYITTSNLDFSEGIRVNYASYLCDDASISDDPTLMLINLLMSIGIRTITIAGYDGFSANPDENYFDVRMSLGSNIESKMKKNDLIHKQVLKLKQQIDLDFLTDTMYL